MLRPWAVAEVRKLAPMMVHVAAGALTTFTSSTTCISTVPERLHVYCLYYIPALPWPYVVIGFVSAWCDDGGGGGRGGNSSGDAAGGGGGGGGSDIPSQEWFDGDLDSLYSHGTFEQKVTADSGGEGAGGGDGGGGGGGGAGSGVDWDTAPTQDLVTAALGTCALVSACAVGPRPGRYCSPRHRMPYTN